MYLLLYSDATSLLGGNLTVARVKMISASTTRLIGCQTSRSMLPAAHKLPDMSAPSVGEMKVLEFGPEVASPATRRSSRSVSHHCTLVAPSLTRM